MKKSSGFTLIELLIVVLIIAILAAIAVPNFLEFQTRAKVTRVKSDHRTLATGLEAYMVDWGSYVDDSDESLFYQNQPQRGLVRLTTPISYITACYHDVFPDQQSQNPRHNEGYYSLGSGADHPNGWPVSDTKNIVQAWLLISSGPDRVDSTDGNDSWPWGGSSTNLRVYDPTNGTISTGDIYRGGGDYKRGDYHINGISHETGFELNR